MSFPKRGGQGDVERSLRKARKDTTSSSFFLRIRTAGGKDDEQRNLEGGGPDVPRLGGAWDHPVTLGCLSPWLTGERRGGSEAGGLKPCFFVRLFLDFMTTQALHCRQKRVKCWEPLNIVMYCRMLHYILLYFINIGSPLKQRA